MKIVPWLFFALMAFPVTNIHAAHKSKKKKRSSQNTTHTQAVLQGIDLSQYEKKIFSQNGEDGVTVALFNFIGTDSRYFVEFGSGDGNECNSRVLMERFQWQGLMMDGHYSNPSINLHTEFVTAENINALFEKYKVPSHVDFLSIDIDYNDFHVWNAIDSKYRPRVVVIEYNAKHPPGEDKTVPYDPHAWWDGCTSYFGASIDALFRLGRKKGYSLVYADNIGVNLFFVRDDILETLKHKGISFKNVNDVQRLYKPPKYAVCPDHPCKNSYVRAQDLLK